MLFDQITGAPAKGLQFSDECRRRLEVEADCRSRLPLARAKISLSVAKCEASEKWWPTWHLGRGERKALSRSAFCLGKYAHSSSTPPLASFLAGDACKLITSLCY